MLSAEKHPGNDRNGQSTTRRHVSVTSEFYYPATGDGEIIGADDDGRSALCEFGCKTFMGGTALTLGVVGGGKKLRIDGYFRQLISSVAKPSEGGVM